MSTTTIDEQRTQGTLDPRATGCVIAQACEVGARMEVRASGTNEDRHFTGTLGSTNGTIFEIRLDEAELKEAAFPSDSTVACELLLGGRRYAFETQCTETLPKDFAGIVRLTHPLTMTVSERRRSRRRKLVPASQVTLRIAGDGESSHCRGALLNLSMRGLACRVTRQDATRTPAGTTVHVEFRTGGESPAFDLLARVVGLTQAASRDHTVVGVEFIPNETYRQAWEAFRGALEDVADPEAY